MVQVLSPNITGDIATVACDGATTKAFSFTSSGTWFNTGNIGPVPQHKVVFNAHNSNAIYTDSGKVFPLSLHLNYIVKC